MPALPVISPATCASEASRSSSSSVGWLERWSLIASFADADQRIDEDDVAAHAAGQRGRRHVVAAAVAPGGQALLAQRVASCATSSRGAARDIVGAEQADHAW